MTDNTMTEQSVLGAILIDAARVMPLAAEQLRAEDFLNAGCRSVYAACLGRFEQQRPIDPIALIAELGDEYREYVVGLIETCPSVSAGIGHIPLVAEAGRRKRAIDAAIDLQIALDVGEPLEDCQTKAAQLAQSMSVQKSRCVGAAEGFQMVREAVSAPRTYIETGFRTVDKYLRIAPGDFVIIAARPSAGKTALTLQIALHMAKRRKVAYFSCETSALKLYERAVSNFSRIDLEQIKCGGVNRGLLEADREAFSGLSLTVVESAGWTPAQVRAKSIQLGAEVVFIDYMTLLRGEGKSLYEKASDISMALHTMAQQTGIALVGLSQLNRAAGKGEPDMTNLRESGQFEQDADAILFIHSENADANDRKIIIAKNKEGMTGDILFRFEGKYQRFVQFENGRGA